MKHPDKNESKLCERCGNRFYRPYKISSTQWENRQFCSVKCIHIALDPLELKRRRNEHQKLYYQNNKEKVAIYRKEYQKKNKEKCYERSRLWREKNAEHRKLQQHQYREINKVKIRNALNRRRAENINVHISNILRNRIGQAMRRKKQNKEGSGVKDLGCSVDELRFYLEGKFTDGMNWNNWGQKGWHIDHIVPLAFFDLTDRAQFLQACHYTNLQPMWAMENYKKSKKNLYAKVS